MADFKMPDMGDLMGQMEEAMAGLGDQMGELSESMEGFGEQHEKNAASLAGEPDWLLEADIKVGDMLHLEIEAEFDLAKIVEAATSTEHADFGKVVKEAAGDVDDATLAQIMEQLGQGRSIAQVLAVEVKACTIAGAPGDAAANLELSPEAGIPLSAKKGKMAFEFAPVLTIKNEWENASIPTFEPMADQVTVPLLSFKEGKAFTKSCVVKGEGAKVTIGLSFEPK